MIRPIAALFLPVLLLGSVSAEETTTKRIRFEPGKSEAVVTGKVTGRDDVLYQLNAREGQFLQVRMLPEVKGAEFNIYIPGRGPGDEALYTSSVGGRTYLGQLYKTGEHSILVFQNRAAARRGETAEYKMLVRVTDSKPADEEVPAAGEQGFRKEVACGKIKFQVEAPAAGWRFTITPSGLEKSSEPISMDAPGRVVDVLIGDIDGDNSPEVAVISEEPEEQRRRAQVFTTFAGNSFGMVNFPDLKDPELLTGYAGGDEFAFVENTFIRRFPLYTGGEKSGKTRQLQFKLKPGEAMKQLRLDRHMDY